MKNLSAVVEEIVSSVKTSAKFAATVGWRPVNTIPAAVVQMRRCETTPLDVSGFRQLVDAVYQIDVWHVSAKARDEAVEKILQSFEELRPVLRQQFNVFRFAVEGLADVDDETGFRKTILIRLKMVD